MEKIKSFKDISNQWRFRVIARNGQTVLVSESYRTKRNRNAGIDSVRLNAQDRKNFEQRKAKNGQQYFVLKARNGQVIGVSEMYKSQAALDNGIDSVMQNTK